jgi:hypothetical protein
VFPGGGCIRSLVVLAASLALASIASAPAVAAPGTGACSDVTLSFGVDPSGPAVGNANCTVGGRSGAVTFSGTYTYGLNCPDNDISYRGSLTATWADGSTAFTTGYLFEVITWKPSNARGNLDSGEASVGFSHGEAGPGDFGVGYNWYGGPGPVFQNLSPCESSYGDPTGVGFTAKYLTQAGGAPPPVSTEKPAIGGTAQTGKSVYTTDGAWAFFPASIAYQWQRCNSAGAGCGDIAGATSGAYAVVAADEAHTLRARVTACSPGGCGTATSDPSAVVGPPGPTNWSLPRLYGNAVQGEALIADEGGWNSTDPPSLTYTYGWERCDATGGACTGVPGETSSSYTMTLADVGHRIRLVVTAHDSTGASVAKSVPSDVVQPSPPP